MITAMLVSCLLAPMPAPADDGLDAAALARVETAVVPLLIEDDAGHVRGRGTAFLVSADGFAITSYHVTKGAFAASVLLRGGSDDDGGDAVAAGPVRAPVELCAVAEDLDLALLWLAPVDGARPRVPAFLALADVDPAPDDAIYAAGYPAGSGFTITAGVVRNVLDPDRVSLTSREGAAVASGGRWIEMTAPIRPGNSGGPLLDADGRVVGVNTWIVTKGAETNLALAVSNVRPFLMGARGGEAIGFVGRAHDRAMSVLAAERLPEVRAARRYRAADVQSAITALRTTLDCRACNGRGETAGGPCVRCGGDGLGPAPAVWRAATRVAERAAALAENEPRPRDRLDGPLRRAFETSSWRRSWDERLRARAVRALSDLADAWSQPVVLDGRVVVSAPGRTVIMVDRSTVVCVAGAPVEATTGGLQPGDRVVAGGLVAGAAGAGVVVLQGGFVVERGDEG